MKEERGKPGSKSNKTDLLNDLEDLSGLLNRPGVHNKELTLPQGLDDLPVLKSFVEDVPTLSESAEQHGNEHTTTLKDSTDSVEYQAIHPMASKLVDEVIQQFIPQIEAELRKRLEQQIDEYLNKHGKNTQK